MIAIFGATPGFWSEHQIISPSVRLCRSRGCGQLCIITDLKKRSGGEDCVPWKSLRHRRPFDSRKTESLLANNGIARVQRRESLGNGTSQPGSARSRGVVLEKEYFSGFFGGIELHHPAGLHRIVSHVISAASFLHQPPGGARWPLFFSNRGA